MMKEAKLIENQKIAIVGMDAYFSCYKSLDAFERSIYENKPYSIQEELQNSSVLSKTEILQKFECLINNALQDAAINSEKVAIIVANNSQQQLAKLSMADITEVDSVFLALEMAQKLLSDRLFAAVVVGAVDPNPQNQAMGAVVLTLDRTSKQQNRIYATIDALSLSPNHQEAFDVAAIEPEEIAYLEILGNKRLEEVAIESTLVGYRDDSPYSCAVSSVTNLGYFGIAAEIASLIKTALCLYYRYIPSVPQWDSPTNPAWQKSPFYVATQAKPWFLEAGVSKRVAGINSIGNSYAYLILAESTEPQQRRHNYLEQTPYYLFPLAANDSNTLLEQLRILQQTIANSDLAQTASQTFTAYQKHPEAIYALAILGRNKPEILREIDRAFKGIVKAFANGKDWQTPVGSYFSSNPLGKKGKVAYVYPSAYNAHLGLGKDLFRLFPNLVDDPVIESTCNRVAKLEKLLYPRSQKQLSPRELEVREKQLMDDPLAMLELETGFAGLITTILRDYFQVQPQAAFGYSLGETSMMYSQGIWSDVNQSSDFLSTSALFKTRLAGSQDAVREYWQLSEEAQSKGELWRTYVLMVDRDRVVASLKSEKRVYLTQISTPQEVVIAGDPQGCERVIKSLDCDAFRAPFNHVIHCEAMSSESDELIKLNTLPLRQIPQLTFYSAANYEPINLSSHAIAHSLTQNLTQQLDFPRLVNRVYQDDFRIFIEVGAGSNCARWIKDILKSQEHATISLHRRGTNDFTSLIKALAKLVSHRVKLDLSPLYKSKLAVETIIENRETVDFWQEEPKKELPTPLFSKNVTKPKDYLNIPELKLISNEDNFSFLLEKDVNNCLKPLAINNLVTKKASPKTKYSNISSNSSLPFNSSKMLETKLKQSNSSLSKNHVSFIKNEQEYLANSKTIMQIQIEFLQQMMKQQLLEKE